MKHSGIIFVLAVTAVAARRCRDVEVSADVAEEKNQLTEGTPGSEKRQIGSGYCLLAGDRTNNRCEGCCSGLCTTKEWFGEEYFCVEGYNQGAQGDDYCLPSGTFCDASCTGCCSKSCRVEQYDYYGTPLSYTCRDQIY
ncbi:unnamed protein product [Allacma fusca]|uniref:Uncharacterized protein n=1 Tax=Allacma fusca TaxID=39272 RepID=A0A8J2LBK1_9HEXA|nr:unnamed protein product [Allacma fusca]